MKTYEVKIFKDDELVDTQVVQALDEGKAETAAMVKTSVRFGGAEASYEVTEVSA